MKEEYCVPCRVTVTMMCLSSIPRCSQYSVQILGLGWRGVDAGDGGGDLAAVGIMSHSYVTSLLDHNRQLATNSCRRFHLSSGWRQTHPPGRLFHRCTMSYRGSRRLTVQPVMLVSRTVP